MKRYLPILLVSFGLLGACKPGPTSLDSPDPSSSSVEAPDSVRPSVIPSLNDSASSDRSSELEWVIETKVEDLAEIEAVLDELNASEGLLPSTPDPLDPRTMHITFGNEQLMIGGSTVTEEELRAAVRGGIRRYGADTPVVIHAKDLTSKELWNFRKTLHDDGVEILRVEQL